MLEMITGTMAARRIPLEKPPSESEERRVERLQAAARKRLGDRIKRIRIERGMSLRALGMRCNLSASYLSAIERGSNAATIDQIYRLGHFLGIDPLSLLSED